MPFWKKLLFVLTVLIFVLPVSVLANSAEPPGMIILTVGLPEDAELTLEFSQDVDFFRAQRADRLWESQYRLFYHADMEALEGARLRVTTGEKSFTCPLPAGFANRYSTVLTLDYVNQTLSLGQSPWRQPLLTALRIALTLLVEAAVFWLFGFRAKSSWLIFLVLNLLTQGALNIFINSNAFSSGYWMILYYAMEILIFLGEALVMGIILRERRPLRRVLCALTANAASLAAGIALISNLPV